MPKISVIMPMYNTKPERFKIAIQLFGHLRTYKKCFPALKKHLLNKYNCDIFIHTWDTIDHNTKTWHKNKCKNAIEKVNKNEIVSLYHPKTIKIEKQISNNLGVLTANNRQISILGITSMFYSMQQVNELRRQYEIENSVKYDFVICLRPDILLLEDFNIENFIKKYETSELEQTVFHAGNCIADNFDFQWMGGEDTLFFTKPEASNKIFKKLENFTHYLKENLKISYGPEYFLVQAENDKNLKPVLLKYFFGTHYYILRPFSWKNFRRQLISLKIKKGKVLISFLTNVKCFSFSLNISFFGSLNICFQLGRKKYGIS